MGMHLGSIRSTLFRPSIRTRQIALYNLALQKQCMFSASTKDWKRWQAWTDEEDRMLVLQVNKGTTDHEVSSLLCNRSVSAVRNRRTRLATKGLLTISPPKERFTPEEDSRMLAAKSQGLSWSSVEKLFPRRTAKALRKRCTKLAAMQSHLTSSKKRHSQAFRPEEDALLLDLVKSSHRRSGWKDIADNLPGRSPASVQYRYRMLVDPMKRTKFITGGSNAWSDAELEELDLLLGHEVSRRSIAIHLGRSLKSVETQIHRRQILTGETKVHSPWTHEEREQLAAMYSEGASRPQIARALNRSFGSIDGMMDYMNIQPRNQHISKRWTTVDAEVAFDLYKSGVRQKEIALRLGRTRQAITHKLRTMEFESQRRSSPDKGS